MFLMPTWLHSRMSDSRWVITPLCLSGSWSSFLYRSSVYSCHLLISSAFVRSIPFLSFIVPIFAWNVPLVSLIFLKRYLVFAILLFTLFLCINHWGRLSFLAVLWNSAFKWVYLSFSPLTFVSLLFSAIWVLIYHSVYPKALKNYAKSSLPVLYRWNKKAWLTAHLFTSWLTEFFKPTVENSAQKRFLSKYYCSLRVPCVIEMYIELIVVFIPANTISVLQPHESWSNFNFQHLFFKKYVS